MVRELAQLGIPLKWYLAFIGVTMYVKTKFGLQRVE